MPGDLDFRPHEWRTVSVRVGRITREIICPFCGTGCIGYVWSLAGSGKKCPGCGAKHVLGQSFRRKP